MKLSARNQFVGKVIEINEGAVNDVVKVQLPKGQVITSTITKEAVAELGLAVAQSNLATCYKEGTGCEQNLEKAKEWAMKAAKQGQENAIKNLKEWFGMEIDN